MWVAWCFKVPGWCWGLPSQWSVLLLSSHSATPLLSLPHLGTVTGIVPSAVAVFIVLGEPTVVPPPSETSGFTFMYHIGNRPACGEQAADLGYLPLPVIVTMQCLSDFAHAPTWFHFHDYVLWSHHLDFHLVDA